MVSNNWPRVAIVICSYDRPEEFNLTFRSLYDNLYYPNLHWHIADDGTESSKLARIVAYPEVQLDEKLTVSITNRKGWGANVNCAMRALENDPLAGNPDYIYFTEDDYVLKRPLDLRPYVAAMETYSQIGMVRFGIAGHDGIQARLRELDISERLPEYNEQVGYGSGAIGRMNVLELNLWHMDEWGPFGFYRYSNRPHLKHRRFHEAYGLYPEGKTLAQTEQAVNHVITETWDAREPDQKPPAIIVPCEWFFWHFDHIGKSRQGTEEDVHE